MELILKYFPDLTEEQKRQFAALYDLYTAVSYTHLTLPTILRV